MTEVTVGIGGAAGDGQAATGDTLALIAGRLGLHMYIYNSYQSLIRGGHVWLRLRIAQEKVRSHGDNLHAVLALNQDCIDRHKGELSSGGVLLHNSDKTKAEGMGPGTTVIPFPVAELTKDLGKLLPIQQNTVLLGGLIHLLGFPFERVEAAIGKQFAKKGEAMVKQNVAIARVGYEHAKKVAQPFGVAAEWKFTGKSRPVLTGNEAMAMGAAAAGCKWYSAYPMTPASGLLHWFAAHGEECGVVVKQAEDELAVMNMAIGAGHAGLRAMCGTSGGGFALMTEALGMAAMIESPVVVALVQRAGPSTGVPTKTEQGDLNQAFGASQGDFPRVILAPADVNESFTIMEQAFNLAERYQLPVIVMSDLLLAEHNETVDAEDFNFAFRIDRGKLVKGRENGAYLRYKLTEDGVSPRAYPGTKGTVYTSGTDEHDESGVLISDVYTHPPTRKKMVDKRSRKMQGVLAELPKPVLEGDPNAPLVLIGWCSTHGVILEAAKQLEAKGVKTSRLHIRNLLPFQSEDVLKLIGNRATLVIENNESGQFARHLRAETGHTATGLVLKYDGEPFEPKTLADAIHGFVQKGMPKGYRFVCETPDSSPVAFPRR